MVTLALAPLDVQSSASWLTPPFMAYINLFASIVCGAIALVSLRLRARSRRGTPSEDEEAFEVGYRAWLLTWVAMIVMWIVELARSYSANPLDHHDPTLGLSDVNSVLVALFAVLLLRGSTRKIRRIAYGSAFAVGLAFVALAFFCSDLQKSSEVDICAAHFYLSAGASVVSPLWLAYVLAVTFRSLVGCVASCAYAFLQFPAHGLASSAEPPRPEILMGTLLCLGVAKLGWVSGVSYDAHRALRRARQAGVDGAPPATPGAVRSAAENAWHAPLLIVTYVLIFAAGIVALWLGVVAFSLPGTTWRAFVTWVVALVTTYGGFVLYVYYGTWLVKTVVKAVRSVPSVWRWFSPNPGASKDDPKAANSKGSVEDEDKDKEPSRTVSPHPPDKPPRGPLPAPNGSGGATDEPAKGVAHVPLGDPRSADNPGAPPLKPQSSPAPITDAGDTFDVNCILRIHGAVVKQAKGRLRLVLTVRVRTERSLLKLGSIEVADNAQGVPTLPPTRFDFAAPASEPWSIEFEIERHDTWASHRKADCVRVEYQWRSLVSCKLEDTADLVGLRPGGTSVHVAWKLSIGKPGRPKAPNARDKRRG